MKLFTVILYTVSPSVSVIGVISGIHTLKNINNNNNATYTGFNDTSVTLMHMLLWTKVTATRLKCNIKCSAI